MSTTINGWPKTACTAVSHHQIVAVTGGRDVLPTNGERSALLRLLDVLPCTTLRHGQASGVDGAVSRLLRNRPSAILVEAWPARWRLPDGSLDKSAGPRRNVAMLLGDTHSPAVEWARADMPMRPRADVLVAWPGGRGTAGCVLAARSCCATATR